MVGLAALASVDLRLGPPLADVSYLLRSWAPDSPSDAPGFPTMDAVAERYAARSGRSIADLDYWMAFNAWRSAAIGEGVYRRYVDGKMGNKPADLEWYARRVERDGEGRTPEFLLQSRGNEAEHAWVPALGRGDDHRGMVLDAECRPRFRLGLLQSRVLDDLPLGIEAVELGGDHRRLGGILLEQEARAEVGPADAAAGIDARPQEKAEMPGLGGTGKPRHVHQRGEPRAFAAAHRQQALCHEGAVEPLEPGDVGHRAQRDQIEQRQELRFRPR